MLTRKHDFYFYFLLLIRQLQNARGRLLIYCEVFFLILRFSVKMDNFNKGPPTEDSKTGESKRESEARSRHAQRIEQKQTNVAREKIRPEKQPPGAVVKSTYGRNPLRREHQRQDEQGNFITDRPGAIVAARRASSLWDVFQRVYIPVEHTEQMLLKMRHIYTMINQIVFFTLCDRAIGSDQRINSIYSLMLYNVIAYCLQYVRDMIKKEDWSPYVNVSEHSNVRHLAMSATKIVLEWTKAVTVIITVVFLVLTFSAKEGLDNYQPTLLYTFFTLLHYVATEKTFLEMFPKFLSRLQLEAFESLEVLWAPVILKTYTIIISAVFAIFQIILKNYRLAIFGIYVNVFLCWKEADRSCFQELKRELGVLGQFRDATSKQLSTFDDICSVCLSPMKAAKVTPCLHLFHAECLRKCLKNRTDCPICKRELRYSFYNIQ